MLRLSSAQVTKLEEHLERYSRNKRIPGCFYEKTEKIIPPKLAMEELVEDILKEVLPLEPQIRSGYRKSERMRSSS